MHKKHATERKEIVKAAKYLADKGWMDDGGNVSMRITNGMLITPKGADFTALRPEQVALVSTDGALLSGDPPSTEIHFHTAIYKFYKETDVSAIVHCHSPWVEEVAAVVGLDKIPAINYQLLNTGRNTVPITREFDLPGETLVEQVIDGLGGGHAVILANHGQVVLGNTLARALKRAHATEKCARVFRGACALVDALNRQPQEPGRRYSLKIIADEKAEPMVEGFNAYYGKK